MKNKTSWINGHTPWNKGLSAKQNLSIHAGDQHVGHGKHLSDETKQKIRLTKCKEKNPMFGKVPWNKDKHASEETKKKLRISHLGKPSPRRGKHLSEITKEKLRIKHIGKTPWNKGKPCPSSIRYGETNPAWQGGKSFSPYPIIFNGKLKQIILERDKHQCQNPDCEGRLCNHKLSIHHIDYNKENCFHVNLITLCPSSNSKANFNHDKWQLLYTSIASKQSSKHFTRMV